MNITTAECDQAFAQTCLLLLDSNPLHRRSKRRCSSLPWLTFILLLALVSVLSIPPVSQAQVLGDPVDVSQDFYKMENIYFIGSRVISFDAETGQGMLQWDRYLRNTTLSFNKIDVGFTRGQATEFPGTEYDQDPTLPFSITFVSPRTVRLRFSTRPAPFGDGSSLMLAGPVPTDHSWKIGQSDDAITYKSAFGELRIIKQPWHIELLDANGHLLGDGELVTRIVREQNIDACIHFAAYAYVGESVSQPSLYYENNLEQGIRLLGALIAADVRRVVFSSTCATYGEPQRIPIDEGHPQLPTNPYGWSKLFVERIMADYDHAHNLKFVALRYFNASGATPERGEHHEPETHLIPLVLKAAQGEIDRVTVFGNDYPTIDGTCVRDYIHVTDLAEAHALSLEYLRSGNGSTAINLGNGQGYSVLEVVEAARQVTGREIAVQMQGRRPGDPSHLVADAGRAHSLLHWQPRQPDLAAIIGSAWEWHSKRPEGYSESSKSNRRRA